MNNLSEISMGRILVKKKKKTLLDFVNFRCMTFPLLRDRGKRRDEGSEYSFFPCLFVSIISMYAQRNIYTLRLLYIKTKLGLSIYQMEVWYAHNYSHV